MLRDIGFACVSCPLLRTAPPHSPHPPPRGIPIALVDAALRELRVASWDAAVSTPACVFDAFICVPSLNFPRVILETRSGCGRFFAACGLNRSRRKRQRRFLPPARHPRPGQRQQQLLQHHRRNFRQRTPHLAWSNLSLQHVPFPLRKLPLQPKTLQPDSAKAGLAASSAGSSRAVLILR